MVDITKMPKLGFGLMRLPEKDGEIDLEQVCRMADAYLEAGLNYFDTAYVYHGGKSEVAAREAIVKRHPRDSFTLATKMPIWEVKQESDLDRLFNIQLERAGVDYFDYYLLHAIAEDKADQYDKYHAYEWGVRMRDAGKIRHFGFSFHGSPELLVRILDVHPEIEFVQIQLNYLDWTNPEVRSQRLYEILRDRNIPIIVMEPVKGGTLANLPEDLMKKYQAVRPDASAASWALRFVASLPGVATILSGMSNDAQMADNLKTFTGFEPLTEEERSLVNEVTQGLVSVPQIGCTACRYCTDGCPQQISIPDIFRMVNTLRRQSGDQYTKDAYAQLVTHSGRADDCIACGQCESVCPQHLPIIELLREAAALL